MMDSYFVYILASQRNGTLYVGVTNDLVRRMSEHKGKLVPGFTRNTASTSSYISSNTPRFSRPEHANAC